MFNPNPAALLQPELLTLLKLEVTTPDSLIVWRFALQGTMEWAGHVWSLTPFSISEEGNRAGGEQTRPKLILPNPDGVFSPYISKGFIDRARVTKYELHPDRLGLNDARESRWYISQVIEFNAFAMNLELCALSDGNSFNLPARRFTQPEFGLVRI